LLTTRRAAKKMDLGLCVCIQDLLEVGINGMLARVRKVALQKIRAEVSESV